MRRIEGLLRWTKGEKTGPTSSKTRDSHRRQQEWAPQDFAEAKTNSERESDWKRGEKKKKKKRKTINGK